MDVHLSPDQEAFIRRGIESGRFRSPEEAVEEALSIWETRERKRAQLLAALDLADAAIARGEGIEMTEQSTQELVDRVTKRGRSELEARQKRS